MPVYHKLVRDQIPEIIAGTGKECTLRVLDEAEYLTALNQKLGEELSEYLEAEPEHALEELADLLEVLRAVALARGFSLEQLEAARAEKAQKRGSFARRLLLEEVKEGPAC